MTETHTSKPSPEPPDFPITVKQVWEFLRANWKYSLGILSRFIKGTEKSDPDKFWEENAYGIIRAFGTLGVAVLLGLIVLSPFLHAILEKIGLSGKEIVRNTYYFLIFIGAGIAASIATWRGRQFERQIQNARFEKAVDMAIDPASEERRGIGFRTLSRMFFAREENFDTLGEEQIDILVDLSVQNFKLNAKKQREDFEKLYIKNRKTYSGRDSKDLFDETHVPFINAYALALWLGLVNKKQAEFNNTPIIGIYAPRVMPSIITLYVFSGMNLKGMHFFVRDDNNQILPPTKEMYANFKKCCFLQVEMHETSVDYVDFSQSHLLNINCEQKGQLDYKMSCVGTIFDEANVLFCNFEGADFKDASFVETNITGSDFRRAKNITEEQFEQGAYWIMPSWMKLDDPRFVLFKPQFPEGWDDDFINSLVRDAQDEEEEGQGEVKGEPSP